MKKIVLSISLICLCCGFVVYVDGNKTYDNLNLGIPNEPDQIIEREGYALGFSQYLKQPLWVIYKYTKEEAEASFMERTNAFKSDPLVIGGSATPSDYLNTGYDRGHLAPAADMRWSHDSMEQSFYMSNMSPQTPALNRDVWKRAESFTRNCAIQEGSIYVVSGPIVTNENPRVIGKNSVVVPDLFYKVIYDITPPEKMMAFVMPNDKICSDIWQYATNVVYVEEMTGLRFFSAIDTNRTFSLKSTFNQEDWPK